MRVWIHRIREDETYKFIPDAEFTRRYRDGIYSREDRLKLEWTPIKVEIPESLSPSVNADGIMTIACPESDELRVNLAEVLTADGEGKPVLLFLQSEDRAMEFALEEIFY